MTASNAEICRHRSQIPSLSPLRSIWLRPAETIASIAHDNPGYRLYLLPILAGFALWPTIALASNDDNELRVGFVLSSLLAFHPVIEVLQVFFGAWLIRATGLLLGGRAGIASIQTAIVWGNLPIVVLAVLGQLLSFLPLFLIEQPGGALSWSRFWSTASIGWSLFALQWILVTWSMVILISGLAAVQGFSFARATFNALLAWLFAAIPLGLAALAIDGSEGLLEAYFHGFDRLVPIHHD